MNKFIRQLSHWGKLLSAAVLVMGAEAYAVEAPKQLIPFQGSLRDEAGNVVTNNLYQITFKIYKEMSGGVACWSEVHEQVSIVNGYVNVLLGAIEEISSASFNDGGSRVECASDDTMIIDFSQDYYLGITLGKKYDGGNVVNSNELLPRHRLVPSFYAEAAGYAVKAGHADRADSAKVLSNESGLNAFSADNILQINSDLVEVVSSFEELVTYSFDSTIEVIDDPEVSGGTKQVTKYSVKNADTLDGMDSTDFALSSYFPIDSSKISNRSVTDQTLKSPVLANRFDRTFRMYKVFNDESIGIESGIVNFNPGYDTLYINTSGDSSILGVLLTPIGWSGDIYVNHIESEAIVVKTSQTSSVARKFSYVYFYANSN